MGREIQTDTGRKVKQMASNTVKVDTPYKNSWADRMTRGTLKMPEHPPTFSIVYTMIFMGGKSDSKIS